ncbi:MAG: tetratricopeptide repeat protein [Chthoniobacteraceae bacterium]|jgi:tetratricopeptide (TPR) repeat protein
MERTRKPSAASIAASRREHATAGNFLLGLALFALAVTVFIPAFTAGFIWDDDQLLTVNPQVHAANGWWTLWLQPQTADYFPLMSTTLWLENQLGHFFNIWNVDYLQHFALQDPLNGYHVMNVLYHATAVVLTWQMLKRLRVPGAWAAAAIFAVHPVCVESVAWISERKNSISQIFLLLAIIKYVRFEENGRLRTYIWAVICFILSLLAKTSVVMLPFILLLLAWWRRPQLQPLRKSYNIEDNRIEYGILLWSCALAGAMAGGAPPVLIPWLNAMLANAVLPALFAGAAVGGAVGYAVGLRIRKLKQWNSFAGFEVIRSLPFLLAAVLLGMVTFYFQNWRAIGGEEIPIGNWWQRIASACFAAGFYSYSAFWPFNIIEIYPQWHRAFAEFVTLPTPHIQPPAPESIPYWIQALPGFAILGLLAACWKYRSRTWARALLTALGCYFLAILPALGLLKMSYMRLTLVADHFQYISIVAVIALVVAAGSTRSLKPLWLCLGALFFATLSWLNWKQTPDTHFAQLIWIAGTVALAAAALAPRIWKYVWGAFLAIVVATFGIVSWGKTRIYHSELTLWSATIEKNPNTWQGHNHLGAALYTEGNWQAAYPHFLRATQLKPENPESHNNLGLTLSLYGRMDEALKEFQTAVYIKDNPSLEMNLGNAYMKVGRVQDGIAAFKRGIQMDPDNPAVLGAYCYLAVTLLREGRMDEAIPLYLKALQIDSTLDPARKGLRLILQIKGIHLDTPIQPGMHSPDIQKAIEVLRNPPPQAQE